MHSYLRSVYAADGFRKLTPRESRNPAAFARLDAVNPELTIALRIILGAAGQPGLAVRGIRVDESSGQDWQSSRVKLLLADELGALFVLCTSRSENRGAETSSFGLLPFADFSARAPEAEGPMAGRPKTDILTSRGILSLDPAAGTVTFCDLKARLSCRYDEDGPSFHIRYGSGPWSRIEFFSQVPVSFQKAMEEGAAAGKVPAPCYQDFLSGLSGVLGLDAGRRVPDERRHARTCPSSSPEERARLIKHLREHGIDVTAGDLEAAEEYLASLRAAR